MQPEKRETVIQLNDKSFDIFIRKEEIDREIIRLAHSLNTAYKGKPVVFLIVLNGAFMFASDLVKKINLDCEVSFVKVSSYVGTTTSGRVDELIGLNTDIRNKHIVIIEDIVDTGITIDKITTLLQVERPSSIEICSLLFKKDAFKGNQTPHYIGFTIPDKFVVGYGLDYNEKGRNIEEIYQLKES